MSLIRKATKADAVHVSHKGFADAVFAILLHFDSIAIFGFIATFL